MDYILNHINHACPTRTHNVGLFPTISPPAHTTRPSRPSDRDTRLRTHSIRLQICWANTSPSKSQPIRGLHSQPYKPCLPTHNTQYRTIPNSLILPCTCLPIVLGWRSRHDTRPRVVPAHEHYIWIMLCHAKIPLVSVDHLA